MPPAGAEAARFEHVDFGYTKEKLLFKDVDMSIDTGDKLAIIGYNGMGKTTLLKKIIQEQHVEALYLNCDEPQTVAALTNCNLKELQMIVGANKFVVIDEAQKVDNIGLTLKLIVDNMPDVQVIATGSSAFELRNCLNEPLTGQNPVVAI